MSINAIKKIKSKRGITLIALVVTIVIMIILATITINVALGDNGIIKQAEKAKEMTSNAVVKENEDMNELLEKYANVIPEKDLYNSPFQYQLLNSYITAEIESKLGRRLEVTDIFYEVKEDNPRNNEVYIYNIENNVKVKVDKSKLNRTKAIWYWLNQEGLTYFNDETKINSLLNFCQNEKITDIYISSITDIEEAKLKEFIVKAYDKGIMIEYLTGDPSFISTYNRQSAIYEEIEYLKKHNEKAAYNEKIRGIHYDVEIHTRQDIYYDQEHLNVMPRWNDSNTDEEKNSDRKKLFVDFIIEAYKEAKKNNLTVAFDIPPLRYTACIVNYNNIEKSLMEYVIENSDYCSTMPYKNEVVDLFRYICLPSNTEYDKESGKLLYTSNTKVFSDGTERCRDTVIELAVKHRKNILIGLSIGDDGEDNFELLGKSKMYEIVDSFKELISKKEVDIVKDYSLKDRAKEKCGYIIRDFDNFGFSYHHAIDFYNMK